MSDYEEHDHDEDCEHVEVAEVPVWRFSAWDVLGAAVHTIGAVLISAGSGFMAIGKEFAAAANYSRQEFEVRAARAEWESDRRAAAEDLRRLVEGE